MTMSEISVKKKPSTNQTPELRPLLDAIREQA